MAQLTKEQIQALVKLEGKLPSLLGVFDLYVKGFEMNMRVSIALGNNVACDISDRTVQTINELANLTEDHYQHILRLMFDDAMVVKEETSWGDPSAPREKPPNWFQRVFGRLQYPRYTELAPDDPRHPLFGLNTPEDIPAKIKWEGFFVDDDQETQERIAFLTCYPPWEVEHGREIAIRNGTPIGISPIDLNPYWWSD